MSIADTVPCDKVDSLDEITVSLSQFAKRAAAKGVGFHEFERELLDRLLVVGHAVTSVFISEQGDGDLGETVVASHGAVAYRSEEPANRTLRTVFGRHEFRGFVYHQRKHPNTPIVFRPIDARMSLSPSQWSPLLEEFTQLFAVDQAFELAAANFERIFRQRLSVDTMERVNHQMGASAAVFLDSLQPPPAATEGELLVMTGDGKGVPMVKADADRLAACEERPTRPGNRRMATVASTYSVDRHHRTAEKVVAALFRDPKETVAAPKEIRPEPCHKRVVARLPALLEDIDAEAPITGTLLAISWAASEVAQRLQPSQELVCVMDGQPSLWDSLNLCLEDVHRDQVVEILDIVHVSSYVWKAAKLFHGHKRQQEAFSRERLLRILNGDVKGVITNLRNLATRRDLTGAARKEIDTICGYFTTNCQRMRYDDYLARGYPIASGVIEGACRHLVKDRMERSGMRWTQSHAQAMLDVRAVHQSSYWDQFQAERTESARQTYSKYLHLLPAPKTLVG